MAAITIYHNPRCTKSRATLALLQERGANFKVVEYLQSPPNDEELTSMLAKLKMSAAEFMRKGEASYEAHVAGKQLDERQLIAMMVQYPELIERPVVVMGDRAIIGRPPENLFELFK